VTPMERTMVTTATKPSGIAATARLIASKNISRTLFLEKPPFFNAPKTNMNMQIPSTAMLSTLLSSASFFCRGVFSSSVPEIIFAIYPFPLTFRYLPQYLHRGRIQHWYPCKPCCGGHREECLYPMEVLPGIFFDGY